MEHRYDNRFPADHKTLIFKNGLPVAIGRIRNVSRGGVFVKTELHAVDVNQALEIELIARDSNRISLPYGERRLCKALVMHKSNGGVGLLLREDCEETQAVFSDFFAEEFERNQAVSAVIQLLNDQKLAHEFAHNDQAGHSTT